MGCLSPSPAFLLVRGAPLAGHPPTPMNPEHILDSDSRQPCAPLSSHCLYEPVSSSTEWEQIPPREQTGEDKPALGKHCLSPRGLLSYYIITVIILLIAVIISSHIRIYLLTPGGQPDNSVKVKVLVTQSCPTLCDSMNWRRQWHPTPVLLPGKSHGRRSLVGCSPWDR